MQQGKANAREVQGKRKAAALALAILSRAGIELTVWTALRVSTSDAVILVMVPANAWVRPAILVLSKGLHAQVAPSALQQAEPERRFDRSISGVRSWRILNDAASDNSPKACSSSCACSIAASTASKTEPELNL